MTPAPLDQVRSNNSVTTLRGASPVGVGRRFWVFAGALALVVFALALGVSFTSAAHDNARIDRLHTRGVALSATVSTCLGNLGGSGSNASSYTCRATYSVQGATYDEVVGLMSSFSAPGTRVAVVADPSRLSTIELASAVATSSASNRVYLVPGLLSGLFVALALGYLHLVRSLRSASD